MLPGTGNEALAACVDGGHLHGADVKQVLMDDGRVDRYLLADLKAHYDVSKDAERIGVGADALVPVLRKLSVAQQSIG